MSALQFNFKTCILHLARGDIAQLVELRSCNWVVAITGWMSNCPGTRSMERKAPKELDSQVPKKDIPKDDKL
ncbi:hypothetical protein BHE74_00008041 [Ensete ventricosum]|nr:hypothetical protein GW17_00038365 [Ensete ventricosum]RWW83444.1 hypothetical protein BHE74_00008041 [Ensete ventricosum]RZR80017.1 hypothetical protein BHM03_00005898 [Ensete ventricosum]